MKKSIQKCLNNPLPYTDFIRDIKQLNYSRIELVDLSALLQTQTDTTIRFAIIKEIIKRQTGLTLFDTQLSASRSLIEKRIAELPTGEGKTLSAVVAAISYALDGHNVHVLVFNDYLAKRDWSENRKIYEACGMTVGFVDQHSTVHQRKAAYSCDITYVSAKQAGFDYLKDFMAGDPDEIVFPSFNVAIVDEADSIMIDECITPLVLAGEMPDEHELITGIDACVRRLSSDEFELSYTDHQVWLTENGINRIDHILGLAIYDEKNINALAAVQNALDAHFLLQRDKDYIVKDDAVQLVECTTGRVVDNKRYPDLLHRAVEVKEGLAPAPLTMIYNSITMQDFLKLYETLCGMTGTAATSEKELLETYDLHVDVIPPHTPSIRTDHEDRLFRNQNHLYESVIEQVKKCYRKKQPVLIGTKSVAESEFLSEILSKVKIPHTVLNAKNNEEEAEVIAQAGCPARVTISTNMAGRGVDIKLGGKDGKYHEKVVEAGGLFIIGVGINSSERIDNQLRGRAGRQGDTGESSFFICLDDTDLSARMTPLEKVRAEIGNSKKRLYAVRRVQHIMEGESAEARYTLSRFSSMTEIQRARLSELRLGILNGSEYFACLENSNPDKYKEALRYAGIDGIKRAEQQLALFYINKHWAECLYTLETVRSGIHFMVVGRSNPLEEYCKIVINLSEQMLDNIKQDISEKMETLTITSTGINMDEAGLNGGTTTWTYAVDESLTQFNVLHQVARNARESISGEEGILTNYYRKKRDNMDLRKRL